MHGQQEISFFKAMFREGSCLEELSVSLCGDDDSGGSGSVFTVGAPTSPGCREAGSYGTAERQQVLVPAEQLEGIWADSTLVREMMLLVLILMIGIPTQSRYNRCR